MNSTNDDRDLEETVDDDLTHLSDLTFNYEGYFERSRAKELSEQERDEWHARIMGLFCREIFDGKKPPDWILNYIAEQFCWVLDGKPWNHAFPLPWDTPSYSLGSRAEDDAMDIFIDISSLIKSEPEIKITSAITRVAKTRNVSFEKARAAWYRRRSTLPAGFLKKTSKI